MTGEDERLLAEIEKLLKRKLPVEHLQVEGAASARPRRERDSERRPERDSAERSGRGGGDRDRGTRRSPSRDAARSAPASKMPGFSDDAFFYEPYQPASEPEPAGASADSEGKASDETDAGKSTARRRPARAIPALLGGKKS